MLKGLLRGLGRGRESVAAAATPTPDTAALVQQASEAMQDARYAAAEHALLEARARSPGAPEVLGMLGQLYMQRLQFDFALDYFDEALGHASGRRDILAQLSGARAGALLALGRFAAALAEARQAAALDPESFQRAADVLFVLNQDPSISPAERFAEHRRVAARFLDPVPRMVIPRSRLADPERRLRIGYLSGDFRDHAVAFFLDALFTHRDASMFGAICFQTIAKSDERTSRLRGLADGWHDVTAWSDDTLAAAIRDEQIDILVDLAGLTRGGRPLALARKPAPIQMSYLGYLCTTGSRAIDYRITDACADPPGDADRQHSETLLRLPGSLWCFSPWQGMPEPLSSGERGSPSLVFGSFNRLTKIHEGVLRTWARLLVRVPGSTLRILDVPSVEDRGRLLRPFLEAGVDAARVVTLPRQLRAEYWQTIRATDIALDPFPYNGGATTCECLWLGVPVVTKAGEMGFSRSATTILHNVGLPELVAQSEDGYVDVAAALAADPVRLGELQRGLRQRMQRSPLMDAPGFMRRLETTYRDAWRRACAAAR